MKVFLFAGLIYLAGIAGILLIKPDVMFRKDGTWKEFGLGRNPNNYTWCPFWLFCIFWALVSYIISTIAVRLVSSVSKTAIRTETVTTSDLQDLQDLQGVPRPRRIRRGNDLPEGYYVLSKPIRAGETPSYTYLGPQLDD
jgi:hypothetical protein